MDFPCGIMLHVYHVPLTPLTKILQMCIYIVHREERRPGYLALPVCLTSLPGSAETPVTFPWCPAMFTIYREFAFIPRNVVALQESGILTTNVESRSSDQGHWSTSGSFYGLQSSLYRPANWSLLQFLSRFHICDTWLSVQNSSVSIHVDNDIRSHDV